MCYRSAQFLTRHPVRGAGPRRAAPRTGRRVSTIRIFHRWYDRTGGARSAVPLRRSGRIVANAERQLGLVGELQQLRFSQPDACTVRPAAVNRDGQLAHPRIARAAHVLGPCADRPDRELGSIGADYDTDEAIVGANIVAAIRHHLAGRLVIELVLIQAGRLALRAAIRAAVLVKAYGRIYPSVARRHPMANTRHNHARTTPDDIIHELVTSAGGPAAAKHEGVPRRKNSSPASHGPRSWMRSSTLASSAMARPRLCIVAAREASHGLSAGLPSSGAVEKRAAAAR